MAIHWLRECISSGLAHLISKPQSLEMILKAGAKRYRFGDTAKSSEQSLRLGALPSVPKTVPAP